MSTKGVVYLAWGEIGPVLERSIASLKRWHPELPYTVIDLPAESTYLDKAWMRDKSPYDLTAYLDADTVVMGDLSHAFLKAEQFGVALCINEVPWARRYMCMSGDSIEYQAGIIFFDKIKSKPLFDAWVACVREVDSSSHFMTDDGIARQICNDQAGLAKAIEDTGFNPFVLPLNYNLRPSWQKSIAGPVKIWHDYSDPPTSVQAFSEQQANAKLIQFAAWDDPEDHTAPVEKRVKVACAMSVPRLGFTDNFFSICEALAPLGIKPVHYDGVFWGQCLERVMSKQLEADWILTIDYDSVFTRRDVERLIKLAASTDQIDALAAMQLRRRNGVLLAAIAGENGTCQCEIEREQLEKDVLRVDTAHFGLTMLRVSALKKLRHPWFIGSPNDAGLWEDGKTDEDIHFWKQWKAAGNSLYLANRIPVGHIESLVTWPDENLEPVYQHAGDFWHAGKPEEAWR